MTRKESRTARSILRRLGADRTETIVLYDGGVAVTAYWIDGGQRVFYALDSVEYHQWERELAAR